MNTEANSPVQITVSADRTVIGVTWTDGYESEYSADLLRRASRSSDSVRAQIDGNPSDDRIVTRVTAVNPVGHYAVNIVFSDGHDRGIYPWSYLRDLDARNPE